MYPSQNKTHKKVEPNCIIKKLFFFFSFWAPVQFSYLQNISPALLIENIILEVFSVYLLRLLDLLWSHYLSWRGTRRRRRKRGRREDSEARRKQKKNDKEDALECYTTVRCCNWIRSVPCVLTRRLCANTCQPTSSSHVKFPHHRNCWTRVWTQEGTLIFENLKWIVWKQLSTKGGKLWGGVCAEPFLEWCSDFL